MLILEAVKIKNHFAIVEKDNGFFHPGGTKV